MKKEDAEELTQALGQTLGGSWRTLERYREMGVAEALGVSMEEWVQRIGGYTRMSIPARREAVKELAAKGNSTREIAEVIGTSHTTVERDLAGTNVPDNTIDYSDSGTNVPETENATPTVADKRKAGEDARKAILETPVDPEILPGVYAEDFFIGADRIADASVDLVFTDPPYDKSSVDLYRKAAKVAARILKPGGSFVVYSGQKYLPEVYGLINQPALRYWWTFAGVHSGGNQMLQKLGIRCGWKPILWYVKGTRGDVSEVLTDVVTGAREKTHHEWQQSEAEALHFIEKLTFPDGLVVDFFLGGGTTKVAADELGRRFIGFEIRRDVAEKAKARIVEAKAA